MKFFLLANCLMILFAHRGDGARTATVTLFENNSNMPGGVLTISQFNSTEPVMINGFVNGPNITANTSYGFHVHKNAVSEPFPNCTAAAEHLNPYNVSHGPPSANISSRHVGDLGNITAGPNGIIIVNITDYIIDLYNMTRSILNRSMVVHAMFDDGGNTNNSLSSTTGNAGGRVFCGLIKLISDTDPTTTTNTTATTTTTTTTTTTPSKAPLPLATIKSISSILSIAMTIRYLLFP